MQVSVEIYEYHPRDSLVHAVTGSKSWSIHCEPGKETMLYYK